MTTTGEHRVSTTVPLNWEEVWFTNCPMVSANNVDQELGWCRGELTKIGVEYAYFRSNNLSNFYPHYIHNLDNLIRVGGLYPPIHVHADMRRTVLLGATQVYEGGVMMVRARDDVFRIEELTGNAGRSCRGVGPLARDPGDRDQRHRPDRLVPRLPAVEPAGHRPRDRRPLRPHRRVEGCEDRAAVLGPRDGPPRAARRPGHTP